MSKSIGVCGGESMTYRSSSLVRGHFRNGHWVSPHFRSATTVQPTSNFYSHTAVPAPIHRRSSYTAEVSDSIWGAQPPILSVLTPPAQDADVVSISYAITVGAFGSIAWGGLGQGMLVF